MRALLAFVFLAAPTGSALALTCTAPGHPSCTITCPGGCGAVYSEPNGPCHTFCSGAATMAEGGISLSASGVSMDELSEALSNPDEMMQEQK